MADMTLSKDIAPPFFCGCGSGFALDTLKDILNAFSEVAVNDMPYVSLEDFDVINKRYTPGGVDLILYFLNHLNYIEHSGSVNCSAWLTDKGVELREWANSPDAIQED